MADLTDIQATDAVKIIGASSNGTETNPVNSDSAGGLYVSGTVASGTADAGQPVKIGGKFNSTPATFTNGQRADLQMDDNGYLLSANGKKATYSAAVSNLIAQASPTDIVTIQGSASKVVKITGVEISGTQTTAGSELVQLIKRSTLNTGGGTGTIVQAQSSYTTTSSTTATVTVTSTGAGNLLVMAISNSDNRTVSSISDGTSTFTSAGAAGIAAALHTEVWFLTSSNAGKTTMTVTFSGLSTTKGLFFWELNGTGKTVDQTNHVGPGTVAATDVGGAVTNTNPDFTAAIILTAGTITASPAASNTSFTNGTILNAGTTAAEWALSGVGTLTPTWSDSGAGSFASSTVSFVLQGNNQQTLPAVPHDSSDAAATATVVKYLANPTLGNSVGVVRSTSIFIPTSTGNPPGKQSWAFGNDQNKAIVLNNANESLSINLNGISMTGSALDIDFTWTEE